MLVLIYICVHLRRESYFTPPKIAKRRVLHEFWPVNPVKKIQVSAVLAADTLTALTELNAKAREAREMSEHLKDKKQ